MRVLLYCQYLLGVGHLFRAARLAAALRGHEVVLLTGGPAVVLDLPAHVRWMRQAPLRADPDFSRLIPCDGEQDLEALKTERAARLLQLVDEFRPDVFVTEQYPFGRGMFRFELGPCLAAMSRGEFGDVTVVCSLRDIISQRADPGYWERKVLTRLGAGFQAVLVHADPLLLPLERTFSQVARCPCPVIYTGFVAPDPPTRSREALRRDLGAAVGERLVVAGLGGGRVGHELARTLVAAFHTGRVPNARLVLFPGPLTGPLADEDEDATVWRQGADSAKVTVMPHSPHFAGFLTAADVAVGTGGYNTCMEILSAHVPALLWPVTGLAEQALRCTSIAVPGFREVLDTTDLEPERLAHRLRALLDGARHDGAGLTIDLQGATRTAGLLETLVRARGR